MLSIFKKKNKEKVSIIEIIIEALKHDENSNPIESVKLLEKAFDTIKKEPSLLSCNADPRVSSVICLGFMRLLEFEMKKNTTRKFTQHEILAITNIAYLFNTLSRDYISENEDNVLFQGYRILALNFSLQNFFPTILNSLGYHCKTFSAHENEGEAVKSMYFMQIADLDAYPQLKYLSEFSAFNSNLENMINQSGDSKSNIVDEGNLIHQKVTSYLYKKLQDGRLLEIY